MTELIELTKENISLFADYIGRDIAENIGRSCFRGIVAAEAAPVGALIWEVDAADETAPQGIIELLRADDGPAFHALLKGYGERAAKEGILRTRVVIPVKEGRRMRGLLNEAGFRMRLTESNDIIVKLSEIAGLGIMKKMGKQKIPDSILPLGDVRLRPFKAAVARLAQANRRGLCRDLERLDISWFEQNVSCVSISGDTINGMLLFRKRHSGIIAIQLMAGLDKNFKIILPLLMRQFVNAMEKKYPPDTKVLLDRHNEQALLLSERLLPRGFGIPVYVGSREESRREQDE